MPMGSKLTALTGTPAGPISAHPRPGAQFELARCLLELFYREAHAVKPDCAIGQFTRFPYFADLCDLARTSDLYTVRGDPLSAENAFRARLQRQVMRRWRLTATAACGSTWLDMSRYCAARRRTPCRASTRPNICSSAAISVCAVSRHDGG